uniref:hypothetical protein n=1 Tax=Treponema endosymbiont of Eucomonympha sp. TaxID=1580831 RepID=UPI001EE74DF3
MDGVGYGAYPEGDAVRVARMAHFGAITAGHRQRLSCVRKNSPYRGCPFSANMLYIRNTNNSRQTVSVKE